MRFNHLFRVSNATQTAYFSDLPKNMIVNGQEYLAGFGVVSVGGVISDIAATGSNMNIALTDRAFPGAFVGNNPNVPSSENYLQEFYDNTFNGYRIEVDRIVFNPDTSYRLIGLYRGLINNTPISEQTTKDGKTYSITLATTSLYEIFTKKVTGISINRASRQQLYPNDNTFDDITRLAGTQWDFGQEYKGGTDSGFGGGIRTVNYTNLR